MIIAVVRLGTSVLEAVNKRILADAGDARIVFQEWKRNHLSFFIAMQLATCRSDDTEVALDVDDVNTN